MSMSTGKRAAVCLTAVAVVAGLAGCQDGEKGGKSAGAPENRQTATQVIQAAYKKTSAAKSAKVRMTMTMPAALEGGGSMTMTGVQGWNPTVMDMTMKGSMLRAAGGDGPSRMRMIMLDNAMYMDMGVARAAEMDGKRWMKLDLKAAADASGDKGLQKQLTGGLESANQDPSQQLALLLESPDLKHVGAEKIDGVDTRHYKGTLSFEQMLDSNKGASSVLSAKEREELIASVEKAGMKGYDTEVWVDEDGYPARMLVDMTMAQGTVRLEAHYSDYGAQATVQAPPAEDTVDLFGMLKELGSGLGGA
ncbi:hypothetical protein [Streptomyces sp. NPDC008121]|uniref:hypothetical protein n=1 Tax=Streptomyces sp. NPDC008121 TaxID=3364809 RepID=UPI0036F06F82